jgi:hypothetical protein
MLHASGVTAALTCSPSFGTVTVNGSTHTASLIIYGKENVKGVRSGEREGQVIGPLLLCEMVL